MAEKNLPNLEDLLSRPASAEPEACQNCRFALPSKPNYFCRRLPPAVLLLGLQQAVIGGEAVPQVATFFPQMNPEKGWCGEYQRRLDS